MRDPDATALEHGGIRWSYGRLADCAARVASALFSRGIGAGDRVAFCLPKSPEAVAVIFGAARCGAVFVPLDPSAPSARLASILSDAGARVLIGEGRALAALLQATGEARPDWIIDLAPDFAPGASGRTTSWSDLLSSPASASAPGSPRPGDAAYILYTSGSTGVPKGVVISHANALAFTSWARREFAVGPADRVTSVAPFHFDLSTFDLYASLEGGATVLLVPRQVALFPAALAGYLETTRATITYLVPSTLTGMLLKGDLASRRLDALRLVLFAGEVLPVASLRMLIDTLPAARLCNLYGPTETNVCTWHDVGPADRDREEPLPIGVACSGDILFAVDESGRRIEGPGVEGELLAAGPTVALGYWNDPEKSARLFLDGHPLAPPGARVYRTGDIVSLDESGRWIYRGRRDHQVKSRGYRIELGDIESALLSHPGVAEAAAIALPDPEAGNRIVACVALRAEGSRTDAAALLRHCAERVPRYMVPERLERLEALPKTSTGKIDRPALRALLEAGGD